MQVQLNDLWFLTYFRMLFIVSFVPQLLPIFFPSAFFFLTDSHRRHRLIKQGSFFFYFFFWLHQGDAILRYLHYTSSSYGKINNNGALKGRKRKQKEEKQTQTTTTQNKTKKITNNTKPVIQRQPARLSRSDFLTALFD